MTTDDEHGLGTRAIHAGHRPDPTTGAEMPPVDDPTCTQSAPGEHEARTHDPTSFALETNPASLERSHRQADLERAFAPARR